MEMQLPLLVKKDKPIAGNNILKENQKQRRQSSEDPSNGQASGEKVKEQSAQDAVIQLKISRIEGLRVEEDRRSGDGPEMESSMYPREELNKCYIRILLDDDNYNTGVRLEFNKSLQYSLVKLY